MRSLLVLFFVFLGLTAAHAQMTPPPTLTYCGSASAPVVCGSGGGGSPTAPSYTAPAAAPSTQTSGTTSGTINTFTAALAANAARKGCLIQNTSANTEYVYSGATGSATTTNSFQITAGGTYNCGPGDTNIINIASGTASSVYVVSSQ